MNRWCIIRIIAVLNPLLLLSGCLEFASIDQPSSVLPGQSFTVFVEAVTDGGSEQPYFGICLPQGWTIAGDSVVCSGVYNEEIVYDPNLVLEQQILSPPPNGYYWWVGSGIAVDVNHGSVYAELQIQTDSQEGRFSIDYMLGTSPYSAPGGRGGGLNRDRSDNYLIDVIDEYTPQRSTVFVDKETVLVNWQPPLVTQGLKGYNVYRDGQPVNTSLLTGMEFVDTIASEGVYFYKISSVYNDGSEHLTPYAMRAVVFLGFPGGAGEPHDPFHIATSVQLVSIANDPNLLDKSFVLVNDIDLDPNLRESVVFEEAVVPTFSGSFNGNGYSISNLTITGRGYLGLFGELSSSAKVRNVRLEEVRIAGSGSCVGGLVGRNRGGDVTACRITGTIHGGGIVGGLAGYNWGRITISCSSVDITGQHQVGGLVGCNSDDGNIIATFSTGSVFGTRKVGGLVGWNMGGVGRSYSIGSVSGVEAVGGLVGSSASDDSTFDGGYTVYSFWDVETSGQTTSAGGTPKTTSELKDIRIYQDLGWDFLGDTEDGLQEVWSIEEGRYPVLAILSGYTPPQLQGQGTPEDPYLISDPFTLGAMIYYRFDAHYRLTAPIDLAGICWGRAVVPHFEGTFDGDNFAISNLTIEGGGYLGLFGHLEAVAEVKDLSIVDVNIVSWNGPIGALSGSNRGKASNCNSSGSVSGASWVGGLVGWNDEGSIIAGRSAATVTGGSTVGGLVGYNRDGTISESYSDGIVIGGGTIGGLAGDNSGRIVRSHSTGQVAGGRAGGFVGHNGGSIESCSSTGTVTGEIEVGGFAGMNWGSIITSQSTGNVDGTMRVGGFVGDNRGSIAESFSTGTISGDQSVGGLVGRNHRGPFASSPDACIADSYSAGTVTGRDTVGGLVGENWDVVSSSYSTGQVIGDTGVGGLVGNSRGGDVVMSFWDIETSNLSASAGGTGKTTSEMQIANTFLDAGWDLADETENDTDDIWWILEGQNYPRLWWELDRQ